jgi:FKBP-type peptidyl-prolyl cis-trans isomerase FkpA
MKKNLFPSILAVGIGVMAFTSCIKNNTPTTPQCQSVDPALDSTTLLQFAVTKGIGPLQDTAGMYYQIVTKGTGTTPSITNNSLVHFTYTGQLMDGTIFDSTTNSNNYAYMNSLIVGLQAGLSLIQSGGHIRLLMPSAYAYGCQGINNNGGVQVIAPNSPVYFDVNLVNVQ